MKRISSITLIAVSVLLCFGNSFASEALQDPIAQTDIKGLDLSVKGGYFQYKEPDARITYSGIVSGLYGAYKKDFSSCSVKIRSELMSGNVDYDGQLNIHQTESSEVQTSATESTPISYGASLWYSDSSLLIGKSFTKKRYLITPYTGLGYRYLSNSDNPDVAGDYKREVTYIYLPLVLEFQKGISETRAWGIVGELDILLRGSAEANLSDASEKYNDLQFNQSLGGGIKLAGFYNSKLLGMDISIKPFMDLWLIDNSDTDVLKHDGERVLVRSADGSYGDYCEPANITVTGGLQLALNF